MEDHSETLAFLSKLSALKNCSPEQFRQVSEAVRTMLEENRRAFGAEGQEAVREDETKTGGRS